MRICLNCARDERALSAAQQALEAALHRADACEAALNGAVFDLRRAETARDYWRVRSQWLEARLEALKAQSPREEPETRPAEIIPFERKG